MVIIFVLPILNKTSINLNWLSPRQYFSGLHLVLEFSEAEDFEGQQIILMQPLCQYEKVVSAGWTESRTAMADSSSPPPSPPQDLLMWRSSYTCRKEEQVVRPNANIFHFTCSSPLLLLLPSSYLSRRTSHRRIFCAHPFQTRTT